MSVNRKIHSVSMPAGQDLSSNQFRVVQMSDDGQVDPLEDGTRIPIGILMNKPSAAGEGAEIAIQGSEVKVEAGGAIEEGQPVVANTGGRVTTGPSNGTAAGTTWVVGVCTQPASGSGAFAGVLVNPYFHIRA